jgi:hypothetical protein
LASKPLEYNPPRRRCCKCTQAAGNNNQATKLIHNLGAVLRTAGRMEDALQHFRDEYAVESARLGLWSHLTLNTRKNLTDMMRATGRTEEVRSLAPGRWPGRPVQGQAQTVESWSCVSEP